jgi:hypothetical protein
MHFAATPIFNSPRDPLLWDLQLHTGFDREQVLEELQAINWAETQPNLMNLRWDQHSVDSPCLQAIDRYISSNEFKQQILDIMYQQGLQEIWTMPKEQMAKVTNTGGYFAVDRPGFTCPRHVDSRGLVATGMIMFGEENNPDTSTYFYRTFDTEESYWHNSSKFEHGWLTANMHNTYHEGYNRSNRDRYSYLFSLALDIYR